MKNLTTILLVFLLCTFSLKADNWELFPSNQKTYFYFESEDNKKSVVLYYVDFEEAEDPYIRQYPLRKLIEEATGGCYDNMNLDAYAIETGEVPYNYHLRRTELHFFYVFNDTEHIPIFPQMKLDESWDIQTAAFNNSPYDRLKVTCTALELEEIVAGVSDNVKTFEIEAFDGEMPIDAELENFKIKVSEKYGLVEWFNFEGWVFEDPKVKITLAGLEMNDGELVGEGLPKAADFYPYQAGDVLKWQEKYWLSGGEKVITHTDTILSVEKTSNNLSYVYNRFTITEYTEEITQETKPNQELTLYFFPQHFIDLHYWNLGINGSIYQTLNLDRLEAENGKNKYFLNTIMNATFFDDCRIVQLVDFGELYHTFSTRLGVQQEIETGGFGGNQFNIKLIEASIGEDYFTPIEETSSPNLNWSISPNPTQDYLTIQLNETSLQSIQLQIFNLQGEVMLQAAISGGKLEVSMVDFSRGIYFVQVSDSVNQWTEKVVRY